MTLWKLFYELKKYEKKEDVDRTSGRNFTGRRQQVKKCNTRIGFSCLAERSTRDRIIGLGPLVAENYN